MSIGAVAAVFGVAVMAANLPHPAVDEPLAAAPGSETVVFSGGCFWGVQAVFQHVRGVLRATAGYAGGAAGTAHYEIVSTGTTGHAESVRVVFDPAQVSFGTLLQVFFGVAHDPTELDYQGPDHGTQYRSAIFFTTAAQQRIVAAYIAQLEQARAFPRPIVTQVQPLKAFYPAEDYHQDYAMLHPTDLYILYNDAPKLADLSAHYKDLYVKTAASY